MSRISIEIAGVQADDEGVCLLAVSPYTEGSLAIPVGVEKGLEVARVLLDGGKAYLEAELVMEEA